MVLNFEKWIEIWLGKRFKREQGIYANCLSWNIESCWVAIAGYDRKKTLNGGLRQTTCMQNLKELVFQRYTGQILCIQCVLWHHLHEPQLLSQKQLKKTKNKLGARQCCPDKLGLESRSSDCIFSTQNFEWSWSIIFRLLIINIQFSAFNWWNRKTDPRRTDTFAN